MVKIPLKDPKILLLQPLRISTKSKDASCAIHRQIKGAHLPKPRFVHRWISFNSSLGYSVGILIHAIEPDMGANRIERPATNESNRVNKKEKEVKKMGGTGSSGEEGGLRTNGRQSWRLKRLLDAAGQRETERRTGRSERSLKNPASLFPSISFFCRCSLAFSGPPSPVYLHCSPIFAPWNKR